MAGGGLELSHQSSLWPPAGEDQAGKADIWLYVTRLDSVCVIHVVFFPVSSSVLMFVLIVASAVHQGRAQIFKAKLESSPS